MRGDSFKHRRILSRPLNVSFVRTLANAAVFLASDRASAMTGTTVNLTGGIVVD
jgi:NAD(P)-dependent dehydrogenase (short-subunit alcohol dehydrogenase family)